MSNGSLGGASFYADFGALTALKKDVKANDPQALRAAARQFESLFTDMMLKAMREARLGQGLGESEEGDFYQEMYDQQLALQLSQGRGLGLADLLVQQLTAGAALRAGAANGDPAKPAAVAAGTGTAGVDLKSAPGLPTTSGGESR